MLCRGFEHILGLLKPLALCASPAQGIVCRQIGHHTLPLQCLDHLQDLLRLLAPLASTDQGTVHYHVEHYAWLLHCVEPHPGLVRDRCDC